MGLAVGAHHALNNDFLFHSFGLSFDFCCIVGSRCILDGRLARFSLEKAQPQGVGHHAEGGKAHGGGGEHGVELPAQQGKEDPGGQGDADDVVNERPEQVLADVADDRPGQADGGDGVGQIALHQHYVGRLDGHVGPRADGHAHVGPGQGGGVVDAVAHHGDLLALLLQQAYLPLLVGGKDLGHHVGDAHLLGNGGGGAPVVAGQHDHVQPQLTQTPDGGGAGGLYCVGHGDDTDQSAVLGKIQGRFAVFGQGFGDHALLPRIDVVFLQHGPVARQESGSLDVGLDAPAVDGFKPFGGGEGDAALLGLGHNCLPQGVLGGLFQGGGHAKKLLCGGTLAGVDVGDPGRALGDGARLVQHDSVYRMQRLQGLGGFEQHAVFRALARAHHDGHGGGKAQGAGAGDDQHGHAGGQGHLHAVAGQQPHGGGDDGDGDDGGDEYPGHLVGQLGDGRLGGRGLLHQGDHLGQGGVAAHLPGPHGEGAGFIQRSGDHLVAGALLHGDGLAGQGGLVHGGPALGHLAVHGDGLSRAHQDQVAHGYLLHRHLHLPAVPQDGGRLGGQVDQAGDGLAGLALGAGLQEFAQGDQGQDHTSRLKVQIHGPALHLCQRGGGVARAVGQRAQAGGDLEQGGAAVDHGGGGADGDQGVHVGRALEQGLEAHPVVFLVDDHNRDGQQELDQGDGQGVFRHVEPVGQGPAHHVTHG